MTLSMIGVLAVLAFLVCLGVTPLCRDLFLKRGLVDHPDDYRKLHRKPVPRCGGIGIVFSYFAALGMAYLFVPRGTAIYVQHRALFVAVLPATLLIFLVGLADDLLNLKPRYKLLGQAIASTIAVALGARITLLHGPSWLGWLISLLWLLACTNAVNLIDGMDGLATGVGLTATLTTLVVALLSGNIGLAIVTAPLAGALLAFLRYNFAPASVFLGDSGSLTTGFLLGCLGLVWSSHLGGWGMLGPLFALALPLMDVSLSIGRRFLRRVPIFEGDRGHIHHRVQDLGLSTTHAALLLYGCCLLFATLAVLQSQFSHWAELVFIACFVAIVTIGVGRLEYIEFRVARRMLSHSLLRRAVRQRIHLEEMRRGLERSTTAEECWKVVRHCCSELEIENVQMKLGNKRFATHTVGPRETPNCTLHMPLGEDDWIVLMGGSEIAPSAFAAALEPLLPLAAERPEPTAEPVLLRHAA